MCNSKCMCEEKFKVYFSDDNVRINKSELLEIIQTTEEFEGYFNYKVEKICCGNKS